MSDALRALAVAILFGLSALAPLFAAAAPEAAARAASPAIEPGAERPAEPREALAFAGRAVIGPGSPAPSRDRATVAPEAPVASPRAAAPPAPPAPEPTPIDLAWLPKIPTRGERPLADAPRAAHAPGNVPRVLPALPVPALVELPPAAFLVRTTVAGETRETVAVAGVDSLVDADGNGVADLRVLVTVDPDVRLEVLPRPGIEGSLSRAIVEIDALPSPAPLRDLEVTLHVPLGGPPVALAANPLGLDNGTRSFAYVGYRLDASVQEEIPETFHLLVGFPPVALPGTEPPPGPLLTVDIDAGEEPPRALALLGGTYTADAAPAGLPSPFASFEPVVSLDVAALLAPFPSTATFELNVTDVAGGSATDVAWSASVESLLLLSLATLDASGDAAIGTTTLVAVDLLPRFANLSLRIGDEIAIAYDASSRVSRAAAAVTGTIDGVPQSALALAIDDLPRAVDVSVEATDAGTSVRALASAPIGVVRLLASNVTFVPPAMDHAVLVDTDEASILSAQVTGLQSFDLNVTDARLFASLSKSVAAPLAIGVETGALLAAGLVADVPREFSVDTDLVGSFTWSASEEIGLIALAADVDGLGVVAAVEDLPTRLSVAFDAALGSADFFAEDPVGRVALLLVDDAPIAGTDYTTLLVDVTRVPSLAARWTPAMDALDARVTDLAESVGSIRVAAAEGPLVALPGSHALYRDGSLAAPAASLSFDGFRSVALDLADGGLSLDLRAAAPQAFAARVEIEGSVETALIADLPAEIALDSDLASGADYAASGAIGLLAVAHDGAAGDAIAIAVTGLPDAVRATLDLEGRRADFWASAPIGSIAVAYHDPASPSFTDAALLFESVPSCGVTWFADESGDATGFAFSTLSPDVPLGLVDVALANGTLVSLPGNHVYLSTEAGNEAVSVRMSGLFAVSVVSQPAVRLVLEAEDSAPFAVQAVEDGASSSVLLSALPESLTLDFAQKGNATEFSYLASAGIGLLAVSREEDAGLDIAVVVLGIPERVAGVFDPDAGLARFDPSAPLAAVRVAVANESGLGSAPYTTASVEIDVVPPVDVSWSADGKDTAADVRVRGGAVGRLFLALSEGEPTGYAAAYPGSDFVVMTNDSFDPDAPDKAEVALSVRGVSRVSVNLTDAGLRAALDATEERRFDFFIANGSQTLEGYVDPLPASLAVETDLAGALAYRASGVIDEIDLVAEEWVGFSFDPSTGRATFPHVASSYAVRVEDVPASLDLVYDGGARAAAIDASSRLGSLSLAIEAVPEDAFDVETVSVLVEDLPASLGASWDERAETLVLTTDGGGIGLVEIGVSTGAIEKLSDARHPGHQIVLVNDTRGLSSIYARVHGVERATVARAGGAVSADLALDARELALRVDTPTFHIGADVTEMPSALSFATDLVARYAVDVEGSSPDVSGDACIGEYDVANGDCVGDHVDFLLAGLPDSLDLRLALAGEVSLESSASLDEVMVDFEQRGTSDPAGLFDKTGLSDLEIRLGDATLDAPSSLYARWADLSDIVVDANEPFPIEVYLRAVGSAAAPPTGFESWVHVEALGSEGDPPDHLFLKLASVEDAWVCPSGCDSLQFELDGLADGTDLTLDLAVPDLDVELTVTDLPAWLDASLDLDGYAAEPWASRLKWEAEDAIARVELDLSVTDEERTALDLEVEALELPREFAFVFGDNPNACDSGRDAQFRTWVETSSRFRVDRLYMEREDAKGNGTKLSVTDFLVPASDAGRPDVFQLTYCDAPGHFEVDGFLKYDNGTVPRPLAIEDTFTGVVSLWTAKTGGTYEEKVRAELCNVAGGFFAEMLVPTIFDVWLRESGTHAGHEVEVLNLGIKIGDFLAGDEIAACIAEATL